MVSTPPSPSNQQQAQQQSLTIRQRQRQRQPIYGVYRQSSCGIALTDTLQQLVEDDDINENEAMAILLQFDESINRLLTTRISPSNECYMKGQLSTYRYRDQVWTLILRNMELQYNDALLKELCDATPERALELSTHEIHILYYRYKQLEL